MNKSCRSSGVEHVLGKDVGNTPNKQETSINKGISANNAETQCFPCVPEEYANVPMVSGKSRGGIKA